MAFPPLILHVPHASSIIPDAVLASFVVDKATLDFEHLRLVDWYTDELYLEGHPEHHAVAAPVSRLVVDMERFADDAMETAASVGMGATYTKTTKGDTLRELTPMQREALMAEFYHPHHAKLDTLSKECIESHGRCIVLDCHSFPVEPLPTQATDLEISPEICIGTDPDHTSSALRELVVDHFKTEGFEVLVDKPFRGALVPNVAYGKDRRVQSVMVELRRDLYMNEATGAKLPQGFKRLRDTLVALRVKLERFAVEGSG